ncbi:unnamed protein product [Anisakis simplex]|uniref:Uncharacterized protein n=1 Tax=Anisakis simplex TaxID=6269 RepID=A0A0M3JI79_ANISI|nr:unnamed protein product [Anisakis simplex]
MRPQRQELRQVMKNNKHLQSTGEKRYVSFVGYPLSRSRSNSGSSGSGDDEKKNGDVDEGDEDSADDHHSVENGDEVGERNGRNGKHVEANGNVS